MTGPNATRLLTDPVPAFNFLVVLLDPTSSGPRSVAGFSECSGLEATMQVEEYAEGGNNDRVHKFPGRFTFSNLTLTRGVTLDPTLRLWHRRTLQGEVVRYDGLVILLNEARLPVLAWRWERGLPVKLSGPTLDATSSQTAIETLEISHERIEPYSTEQIGLEVLG
ncbi:phage tail protein [Persicimonas caeni]|uniref:Phage tail protein n=1 Tax=Persicimonas caeni TaxID=2292766 RepID=A0A4Y6PW76_PERCE|nr:phage tail protein [Persicimonas caeni]QDG52257.1 phage tail protein [Persicimonas caeni]QED33479.1 phage tail protein [Persicimonas caeni]